MIRIAGWIVTVVCLVLLFVWVPVAETAAALLRADLLMLILAMLATTGNLALRGVRWMALLGRHSRRDLGLATAVSVVGLALNATVPGKVGELVRIGLAARVLRCRLGEAAMASMIERVIDLAVLSALGFAAITLTGRWGDSAAVQSSEAMISLATSLLLISIAALTLILLASLDPLGLWVREQIARRIAAGRWRRRFRRFSLDIRNGARRIRTPSAAVPALLATLALWGMLGLNVYLVGLAMPGVECSLLAAIAFAAITTLASALPSAPGAWGVYEAAGVLAGAVLVSADSTSALAAFVIATHATQYLPVVVLGLVCWLGMGKRSLHPLENADPGRVGPDRKLDA